MVWKTEKGERDYDIDRQAGTQTDNTEEDRRRDLSRDDFMWLFLSYLHL